MKKYIPQIFTILLGSSYLIYISINNGARDIIEDWPMTILGFLVAIGLSCLAFGKALLKLFEKNE